MKNDPLSFEAVVLDDKPQGEETRCRGFKGSVVSEVANTRARHGQTANGVLKTRKLRLMCALALGLATFTWLCCSSKRNSMVRAPSMTFNKPVEDFIRWDKHSLIVNEQRVFVFGGEFHPFRLPVPDLWLDILQKIKATGMNTVSVYLHWGLLNPSPGVIDLDDWRAIQPLLDAAKLAGLFVILRPGPYINAETTAGGIPHWVTSQVVGELRTNATDFREAWEPYMRAVVDAIVPNQITTDHRYRHLLLISTASVQLDNEYTQGPPSHSAYFTQLKEFYKSNGVVVPLTYNDPNRGANFVNGSGSADIYGLDSYPQRFDCSHPDHWNPFPTKLHEYHERINPNQPYYFPEVQGGSFDGWGPSSPGYDACYGLTSPDFIQVFNHHIWASNAKMMSIYMMYGGTSWGALPFPGVYTSYDYGAAIRENRELTLKFHELKTQGLFLRSSPDFYKTEWITDTAHDRNWVRYSPSGSSQVKDVFVTHLQNPDSRTSFYVARHVDLNLQGNVSSFQLSVDTSIGKMVIPQSISGIAFPNRQSRMIVVDYCFGSSSKVIYSTAQVFFAGIIGGRDILFLHGSPRESHEAGIIFTGTPKPGNFVSHPKVTIVASERDYAIVTFLSGITGLVTLWDSDTQLVLYSDSDTAATFYAPVITRSPNTNLFSYWQFGSNETLLVGGPYLVRNATLSEDSVLSLRGDLNGSVLLTIIGPPTLRGITWNGIPVASDLAPQASGNKTPSGIFIFPLRTKLRAKEVKIPTLSNWKYADSLPEIKRDYSDAEWISANHTETNIRAKPLFGDGRILYGCDYGFCENLVIYRGHFEGSVNTTTADLVINGGTAFAASVWINDHYIRSVRGSSFNNAKPIPEVLITVPIPEEAIIIAQDNIFTIVVDNMGLDEHADDVKDAEKSPRGIRGFRLNDGLFTEWKVQGKLGGYSRYPDKVRGILNEGGSFAERSGWHLPGFDTSSWESRAFSEGLPSPGLGIFVTTFELDIDNDLDIPMSFVFDNSTSEQAYRACLFVNGWFMGKRDGKLGPQTKFPVHEGILDYRGTNTLAVILWEIQVNRTGHLRLELLQDGIYDGGVGPIKLNNPLYDRSQL